MGPRAPQNGCSAKAHLDSRALGAVELRLEAVEGPPRIRLMWSDQARFLFCLPGPPGSPLQRCRSLKPLWGSRPGCVLALIRQGCVRAPVEHGAAPNTQTQQVSYNVMPTCACHVLKSAAPWAAHWCPLATLIVRPAQMNASRDTPLALQAGVVCCVAHPSPRQCN